MKYAFLLTVAVILSFGCSIDRTVDALAENEQSLHKEFQSLDAGNRLTIGDSNEPGEKLKLCITFVNKKTKQALKNQKVHFFHTSEKGEYEPTVGNDESTARLSGTSTTDSNGKLYVETILPGDYGSSADNRHIHTTVFGARPEAYDIGFKQYSSYMSKRFSEGSDQHFLADLKRDKEGNLVAFVTMEPKFR